MNFPAFAFIETTIAEGAVAASLELSRQSAN